MRHYMVDPDNEERLLKVPPHVVNKIKAEAYTEAASVVETYAAERLVKTDRPNMTEDITAALWAAAKRIKALQRNDNSYVGGATTHDSSDTGTEVRGFLAESQEPAYNNEWFHDLYGGKP